jgi:uncharacterized protein YndB with AHSA1/START domain
MADVRVAVTIERPVADVFRVLSTPEITPRWSSNAIEEHTTTPGPPGIGSRRRAKVRRLGGGTLENEIEVTEFEPERRIAVKSIESIVPFTSSWTFTSVGEGTKVDWSWDFDLPAWLRPFRWLIRMAFARGFQRDLARLKSMMESGEL